MNQNYLEFEQPIAELEAKIEELRLVTSDSQVNINEEIGKLREKSLALTSDIFGSLSAWQVAQLARHPRRPYALDYIPRIFSQFDEQHGDRTFGDDKSIIGGTAWLEDHPIMIIAHQKGRELQEKMHRNFGMPRPEGYRKARRLMDLAERFRMPVITFIDTPGAYPGIDAEERGQSEAIASNLLRLSNLQTPVISVVIGEGGSGGALGIGVCDHLVMLQYSTYSVISPEGCASILWKDAVHAEQAAEAMGITAGRLRKLGLVDQVLEEPLGGAHRDPVQMARALKSCLLGNLERLQELPVQDLVARRDQRLMSFGNASN